MSSIKSTGSQKVTWPITVNCSDTGKALVVDHPFYMERIPCDSDPTGFRTYVKCPRCRQTHDLKSDQIPREIFMLIPRGDSMGIMADPDN